MTPRPIDMQAFADLNDASEIVDRIALPDLMVTVGVCPVLGDWVVTQTLSGCTIVTGRHPDGYFRNTDEEDIAEALGTLSAMVRPLDQGVGRLG